jgi:hypothetical protein
VTKPDDFVQWALSPGLGIEEAFCAELLTEYGLIAWQDKNKVHDPDRYDSEKRAEIYRLRRFNPAHRKALSEIDVMRAAETLPELTKLDHWTYARDRPLRDAGGLRFCPRLQHLQIAPSELPDLQWLRFLPELQDMWLQDSETEDYSGLAHCPKLNALHLWLHFSWCDLRALAKLPELESLTLHANLPTLADVGPLKKVAKVHLEGFGGGRAYLRGASDLPDMPLLRTAYIVPWARLDGIEKFSALEELTLEGSLTDLSPLAGLPNLAKLILGGERFTDLAPLARVPRLGVVQLCRELPIDYTPLLESTSLRELQPRYGEEASPEMIGLNAALGGWDAEFLLAEPRPLLEPVFRIRDGEPDGDPRFDSPEGARVLDPGQALHEAEGRWVAARMTAALRRGLGDKNWGEASSHELNAHRCQLDLRLTSIDACDRLPEVIEICRQQLAWLKNRWVLSLNVNPLAEWEADPDEWKDAHEREFEERIADAHDYVERRRQYLAYLERLKEYRLRQELGEETSPEKFAPPPEAEEEEESDVLEEGARWERRDHPRWQEYFMMAEICEEGFWGLAGYKGTNERLTGRVFEVSDRMRAKYDEEEET